MLAKNLQAAIAGQATGGAYIEDVFSTYLYTGNGIATTQYITNGIDLAGEGGMVWIKNRSVARNNEVQDTDRGAGYRLQTNLTNSQVFTSGTISSFNSDGFSISTTNTNYNGSGENLVSWTFRKAPKFFDVVTWTGNDTTNRAISHSLSSVPGAIIIKEYSFASDWVVWHRSLSSGTILQLNTDSDIVNADYFVSVGSSDFTVAPNTNYSLNETGKTYVAYLFAHDAGGFGDAGDQNVISCGSYTGNGSATGPIINLGYEPQWVLIKRTDTTGNWLLHDNMRGLSTDYYAYLMPNLSDAEVSYGAKVISPLATGFQLTDNSAGWNANGGTYIYIAIRRGPMKTPTDGTSVYSATSRAGTSNVASVSGIGFPPDLLLIKNQTGGIAGRVRTKLTGPSSRLVTSSTDPEVGDTDQFRSFDQTGYTFGANSSSDFGTQNYSGYTYINWAFRRAPGFFDVVCYTGTGSNATIKHNLSVNPEVIITKRRDSARNWAYYTNLGTTTYTAAVLNDTYAPGASPAAYDTALTAQPSSTEFYVGTSFDCNASGGTYVAYLFASVAGVSKVGSYTGTGTTLQINCGFSTGARFVLIKRTDSTGDWYLWDSTRGIVSGNDPYLLLNSTAAETTSTDYIDPLASGFEISSTAPAAINASGGTYIYLAIS